MYIHIFIHTYIHIYIYVYICMYIWRYLSLCLCIHLCRCICVCTHSHKHKYIFTTYIHMNKHTYMYVHIYTRSLPKDTGRGDTTLELVNYQTKLLLIRDGSLPQIQQQRLVPGTSTNVSFVDDRLRVGDVVFVTIAAVNMYGQGVHVCKCCANI